MESTVWKMLVHHIDRPGALAWTRRNRRIAIGWGRIGDVMNYQTKAEIKDAIRLHYPSPPFGNNAHLGAPSVWDLSRTMKAGDLVILNGRLPRELVVRVTGDYEYETTNQHIQNVAGCEYYYQRPIELTAIDPNRLWAAAGEAPGKSRYQTLIQCAQSVDLPDF